MHIQESKVYTQCYTKYMWCVHTLTYSLGKNSAVQVAGLNRLLGVQHEIEVGIGM